MRTIAKPINNAFFSKWSPASAYVFGVILTDGNLELSKDADGSERFGSGHVSISQKSPELLEKVGKLIGYSGNMTFSSRREYHGIIAGELYTLQFSSDRVVADLVRLGLRPRKSLTLQFPNMPADMQRHFIRGCWDGDGSVFIEGKTKLTASFLSGSVQLSPVTAEKAGVKEDDWVHIETKQGSIVQQVVIAPDLDPRVAIASFGWWFPENPANSNQWDKSNINILVDDEKAEKATGSVDLRGIPCKVYKCEEAVI